MRTFRFKRVSSLIRERLSWIIREEIEVPDALITLTDVKVGKKLDRAVVKVSVMPSEKAEEALKALHGRIGKLQHLLLTEMNIRPMPRIAFELDRGPENAAKVEKALLNDK